MGFRVLDGAQDAGGNAVAAGVVGAVDVEFHPLAVGKAVGRQAELPDAAAGGGERVAFAVPAVEIPDQRDGLRLRQPFPDHPVAVGLAVDAGELVAGGVGGKRAAAGLDVALRGMEAVEAVRDGSGVGFQPWIVADELRGFAH